MCPLGQRIQVMVVTQDTQATVDIAAVDTAMVDESPRIQASAAW